MRDFALFVILLFSSLSAEEDMAKISEAFGHIIYNDLTKINANFDIAQLVKGIQDAAANKESPMTYSDCIRALETAQEKKLAEQTRENLKEAETFLANNAKEEGVTALENGKVQYRIIKQGGGTEVKPHFSPFIRFTFKTLQDPTFDPAEEQPISLDETIPGLRAGLIGMKEGEKRTLYVHPDFAFGPKGAFIFPPNLLLIFEVEVLKANN